MSISFGPGVSRTLSPVQRQFLNVVFQAGKPPLDSELNLQDSIHDEQLAQTLRSQVHSGFFVDPTQAKRDYVTSPLMSNRFTFGVSGEIIAPILWANVNGWVIPVTGTHVEDGDTSNLILLNPPPASDSRIDLVFLEAWACTVAPNPSAENKPTNSTIWKYGNVEFGGTNITDDLEDPSLRFETTERVQVQYRIRVQGQGAGLGSSVALDVYPDGLDDPTVLGQGTATSPVSSLTWTNMNVEMGDPGLWRAGDGDPNNALGTVDGYTYAIPICAVFRRNTSPYSSVESGGNANQNGGFNRNPSATNRNGSTTFTAFSLTNAISPTDDGSIAITGIATSPLADTNLDLSSTFLRIGDEILGPITSVASNTITIGSASSTRGRAGTQANYHAAGTDITLFNPRPDGLWADQIASTDIMELRKGVNIGGWDYNQILLHNLAQLLQGNLRTSYKQSSSTETQGIQVQEVAYLTSGLVPNSVTAVDRFDGVRTVWSDAATLQPDVTVMCDCDQGAGFHNLDTGVNWDVGAGFRPQGFFVPTGGSGIANGSSIFLYIGGSTGNAGARATFVTANNKQVRFVSPLEYWKTDTVDANTGRQDPVTLRWIDQPSLAPLAVDESGNRPGPMYPTASTSFETPFIVLGGVLNDNSVVSSPVLYNNSPTSGDFEISLPGLNFDTPGSWWNGLDVDSQSTANITNTVLRGQRNLYDMLTHGGQDDTGLSSEVYLVLYGDTTHAENNGAFKVVGAGTIGYTDRSASASNRIRVRALSNGWTAFNGSGAGLTAQLRSMFTNAEDDAGGVAGSKSSLAIVFTDIEGATSGSPWDGLLTSPQSGKLVINTTLQYHPGHAATPRIADDIWKIATVSANSSYLRQGVSDVDSTFPTQSGTPSGETDYPYSQVATWNRLSGLGLVAPHAPSYGGQVVAYSEQDREAEAFVDRGSKTLIFRPFRNQVMTLHSYPYTGTSSLLGSTNYPGPNPPALTPKDGAGVWNASLGFEVPPEFMPRFGRQDIPYNTGTGVTFLSGLNHLFTDTITTSSNVTSIVGGIDNGGSSGILKMYAQTGVTSGLTYGEYGPIGSGSTGADAYQARLFTSSEVISSDLGRGIQGIQMPPYLGLARVYAIYELSDFEANGSAFQANRKSPNALGATNLLDVGADKQTLFILQNGAEDITGETGDHTYLIPTNAFDITRAPTYNDGDAFSDFQYVVEFACFGFAKDWINGNNLILARNHDGAGTVPTNPTELNSVSMTLPSAAQNASAYLGYTRTPYQGDPYMTRDVSTRTTTDYVERYGQLSMADAYQLQQPIQQFDANGDLIPTTPHRRGLEVLASVDFYTTLGTGKVGGLLFAGTPLDVGHVESRASRVPSSSNDPLWRTVSRTYTEGQRTNPNRAMIGVEVLTITSLAGQTVRIRVPSASVDVTLTAVSGSPGANEFQVGGNATTTAGNLTTAINAHVDLIPYLSASNTGTTIVTMLAQTPGSHGNEIKVSISNSAKFKLHVNRPVDFITHYTTANMAGGVNIPVNGGVGTSQLNLTGMTERLPLGILLSDSDFLCENPLCDNTSAMATQPTGITTDQNLLLLSGNAQEYTRFLGGPGQWVILSDGSILQYTAYTDSTPSGTRSFRLYRGGGSAFVGTDPVPGGPIDWVSGHLASSLQPVLKGGALVCKALLVRNLPETAYGTTTTYGDEVQMVILTYGVLGNGDTQQTGVTLEGIISPTGYGEGYAAADRYRCEGRPHVTSRVHVSPGIDAEPGIYPGGNVTTVTAC